MKRKMKGFFLFSTLLALATLSFDSCKKSGSFDSYYYLSSPVAGESSIATVNIDGTNYGAIQYIASPVTTQSAGLNHVKLPYGRHNIIVYDANKNAIISSYIEYTGDEMGSGSWGPAGGGSSCNGSGSFILVGLSE